MRCFALHLLVVASASLQYAAAYDPKVCHQYLAQQAAFDVADGAVVERRLAWSGHTFNGTRYTTSAGLTLSCGAKFAAVIRDHDVTYDAV